MTTRPPTDRIAPPLRELPRLDTAIRAAVLRVLGHIEDGVLELIEDDGTHLRFGSAAGSPPRAVVRVHSRTFYRSLLGGSMGGAMSYINGAWDCDDLVSLVRVATRNLAVLDRLQAASAPLLRPWRAGREWLRRNTRSRSRENIAEHYDIGNDLFELMLDETMSYSNGIFEDAGSTLGDASIAKIDRLCRKLDLGPADHLVEIGTGWGGFAVHAAERYGCRVTTTTISREQHALATDRARRHGVTDRVTVLLEDYRDLRGRFTKLVSVEMIEAIGSRYYDAFFRQCGRLLVEDGLAAIQAICQPHRFFRATRGVPTFVNTHIFPGGICPSIEALVAAGEGAGSLRLINVEDITASYPRTLAAWRANLRGNAGRLHPRFDARFLRSWTLYLSLCEAGFTERRITNLQLVFAKPGFRGERLPAWPALSGADGLQMAGTAPSAVAVAVPQAGRPR